MKKFIITTPAGKDITSEVSLVVKNGEVHVINNLGDDITNFVHFNEISVKHYEAGQRDAKAGFYDKWYRHNAKDSGASYEFGWRSCKRSDMDYQIIEG